MAPESLNAMTEPKQSPTEYTRFRVALQQVLSAPKQKTKPMGRKAKKKRA
jgi:hypothetical protein